MINSKVRYKIEFYFKNGHCTEYTCYDYQMGIALINLNMGKYVISLWLDDIENLKISKFNIGVRK